MSLPSHSGLYSSESDSAHSVHVYNLLRGLSLLWAEGMTEGVCATISASVQYVSCISVVCP